MFYITLHWIYLFISESGVYDVILTKWNNIATYTNICQEVISVYHYQNLEQKVFEGVNIQRQLFYTIEIGLTASDIKSAMNWDFFSTKQFSANNDPTNVYKSSIILESLRTYDIKKREKVNIT